MSNRQRIIDSALTLFNDQGTGDVSTNHIAQAAGISPGNLYYHFNNKGEIVCAIFERLFTAWDETFQLPTRRAPSLSDLEALIAATYQLIWEYRFAYREMAVLLRNDPDLHARYLQVRQRGYEGFAGLIAAFVAAGIISAPASPQELAYLTELMWMVSEFWPVNLELSGREFDKASTRDGINLMRTILHPYLLAEIEE